MGTRMGPGTCAAARRAAGRNTAPPHPRAYRLTRGIPVDLLPVPKVIYIACISQKVCYVGSSTRGARVRLREHVRERAPAHWEEVWVMSLLVTTSSYGVLLAEERVGRLLNPDDDIRPPGR